MLGTLCRSRNIVLFLCVCVCWWGGGRGGGGPNTFKPQFYLMVLEQDLLYNHLQGPMPSMLASTVYAKHLDLSDNDLYGSILKGMNLEHLKVASSASNDRTSKMSEQPFDLRG